MYLHAAIRDVVPATVPPADRSRHPLDRLGLGAVPEILPPQLVDEVIEECGCREVRSRALPARVTLYFVLALWFCPGAGYGEVLRVLFKQLRAQAGAGRRRIPTVPAAVQARRRLGRAPLKALFRRLCETRERKGTAAFAKACEQHPPSTVAYKLTMRSPHALNTG